METFANQSALGFILNRYERLLAAADPRVEDLPLMKSPVAVTTICISYVYIVLSLGPRLMADRKPFNLRNILIVYNAAQTIFSAVLFYYALKNWILSFGWGFTCYSVNYKSQSELDLQAITLCYIYFLSKISELCDTVFFVMKKKNNHVSLLHVFHHAAMPFSVWFGVKYHAGGNLAFFGLPNLFVHIWMYMYYMVAAMGPKYQKYIWWKRHITEMQLTQFAMVMAYILYISCKCNVNMRLVTWIVILDIAFVILFLDFYWKAYKQRKTVKEAKEKEDAAAAAAAALTNGKATHANGDAPKTNESATQTEKSSVQTNGHANHQASNGFDKKNL